MTLYPQARAAVENHRLEPRVYEPGFDIGAARLRARAEADAAGALRPPVPVLERLELEIGAPEAPVPVWAYRPVEQPTAVIVHAHGGGFVFNDVHVHDHSVRRLAHRTGAWVLSVDYRRPPEHRFPAAPDDVCAVLDWLDEQGLATLGLPADAPVLGHGDSAGANLALVAALRRPGRLAALALIYPFLDPTMSSASYADPDQAFDREEAAWYWHQYAASEADLHNPDLAPLLSDRLGTLPPTIVVTAEHDPLRDEGEELARRLAEEGVEVYATRVLGQVHGFWRHPQAFDAAEPLMRQVSGFLGQYL